MSKDDEDEQLEEGIEGGGGRELRREEEAEDEEAKSQKVHPPLLTNLKIIVLDTGQLKSLQNLILKEDRSAIGLCWASQLRPIVHNDLC